ncbi:MAG TPA: hypothetical protein VM571_14750 [Noviherbaspirillum sp.]|jgi:hypothetical protein|nr:hypothetical protein [Noviherbaspirillum sp.]
MSDKLSIVTTEQLWNAIIDAKLTERHLSLMNMNWWPTPPWDALAPYARIAGQVGGEFESIRPLIEDANWRVNLYGTAIAVLADAKPIVASMVEQVAHSWVAPQIAAGIAILISDAEDDVREAHLAKLHQIAVESSEDQEFKFAMSAYAALRPRGRKHASNFEQAPEFPEKWHIGSKWYDLTKMHYERWRVILPYFVRVVEAR